MAEIVLTTLNAKYIHAAFGLRYLMANLGTLRPGACLVEFDINQRPTDIAEVLLERNPKIIGLGIYIWNVAQSTEVIATIKRVRPEIIVVLGGPEVSYETGEQPIVHLADYVITGEADLKFAEVCRELLERRSPTRRLGAPCAGPEAGAPLPKIIPAELPDFSRLVLPYDLYTDDDIAHRIIYVEASRGCPFTCEFCLSSLDIPVRQVPLPSLLEQLQRLLDRGVKQFKFVDRTFNLNVNVSKTILEFFLERYQPGHFYHFEMVPDRLPEALREVIVKFPRGALQFEVGVQTFNEEVGALIKRRQNYGRLEENFRFLRNQTRVHIHADLIAGLPGETVESFAAGFDRLVALGPQEIQVGILKRLRGTPIVRHDDSWQMVYNPHPPYEILQNMLIDFATMQKLRRFARYWDLVGNSGNFIETAPSIWSGSARVFAGPGERPTRQHESEEISHAASPRPSPPLMAEERVTEGRERRRLDLQPPTAVEICKPDFSPFHAFMRWSDWLHARVGRTDSIALVRLMELLFEFLTCELKLDRQKVADMMWRDYQRGGRSDKPVFLKKWLSPDKPEARRTRLTLPRRQARHLV